MSVISYVKKSDEGFFFLLNNKLQCKALTILMVMMTQLGSVTFSAVMCLYSIKLQKNTPDKILALMVLTHLVSQVMVQSLKRIVNRPRPFRVLKGVLAINVPKCIYSFPSGHTCAAFVSALCLSFALPHLTLLLLIIAFVVGLSRIYLGVHYPSDVLVGGVVAYLSFVAVFIFLDPTVIII